MTLQVGPLVSPTEAGLVSAAGVGFAERNIVAVRVRVSGTGFDAFTVDVDRSAGIAEFEVPTGAARRFDVEALGAGYTAEVL